MNCQAECEPSLPTTSRRRAILSINRACRGRSSQISMPGTLVRIGRNSPRYSFGASGFGSYMSRWDGPPGRKIMMTDLWDRPGLKLENVGQGQAQRAGAERAHPQELAT